MMELKIIEIGNEKFVVSSEVNLSGNNYAYLVNIEDNNKVMFALLEDENTISKIEDSDVIEVLIPLFIENQKYVNTE